MSTSPNDSVPLNPSEQEHDQTETPNSNHQGKGDMMVSAKSQIDSITGGASVTEVKDNVVGAAGQTLNSMEKVVGGAAPVAKETLQTAQDKLGLLVGGNAAKQQADAGDSERIDQLDTEHVSDFLRESHMSTKAPPSKK